MTFATELLGPFFLALPCSISSGADVLVLAQQEVAEGLLEGGVAEGIASRVDGGVDVAEPVADGPHRVRDAGLAEGGDKDHDVVGGPRDDESQQDGKDSLSYLQRGDRDIRLFMDIAV